MANNSGLNILSGSGGNYSFGGTPGAPFQVNSNYGLNKISGPDPGTLTISGGLRKLQAGANTGYDYAAAAAENARLLAETQRLLASLRPASPAKIDIAAINAQARRQAEESVNPRYTKELNDMLARQAVKRQRAQEDYDVAVQGFEEKLQQDLEANQIARQRVSEDTDTNIANIARTEDRFQTASGQQFDDQRLAEASQLAASGMTTSGLGRQQAQRSQDQRNLMEQQQTEDFDTQRAAEALHKARSFDDLARSDTLKNKQTGRDKQASKLNLDRLIEDANYEEETNKFDIESRRLGDIASQASGYGKQIFNNYLANIRDPRVFEATARAYGGLF